MGRTGRQDVPKTIIIVQDITFDPHLATRGKSLQITSDYVLQLPSACVELDI